MNEPRRLLEEGSELELELLRSARSDVPAPGARRQTLIALGIGTGIVGAGMTTAGATAASTAGILKWIGIGVLGGALVVGGADRVIAARDASQFAAAKAQQAAARPTQAAPSIVTPAPKPVDEPAPVEEPVAPPKAEPQREVAKAPAAPKKSESTLAEEVAELDRAREALNKGDSQKALEALAKHDQQFGTALLGPEAMVLRIEALAQRGDKPGAAALASQFLAAHPTSPHASRVRSILASATKP